VPVLLSASALICPVGVLRDWRQFGHGKYTSSSQLLDRFARGWVLGNNLAQRWHCERDNPGR
jgi:hypothetical protein